VADTTVETQPERDLQASELYFNRELSWLEFNARVLELAEDDGVPLLERLKFCSIYSSNLDEYFMVRVAGLHDQIDAGVEKPLQDGRTPLETLTEIRRIVHAHVERQSRCLQDAVLPGLADHGIRIRGCDEVDERERTQLAERFRREIFPVLTPLAVGQGRPFPYISNLSLSLGVFVSDPASGMETFARVKVPKEMLPRFVSIGDACSFVPLEELIATHLDQLFPGMDILEYGVFRVTSASTELAKES
jgi:polyphosphate kinase